MYGNVNTLSTRRKNLNYFVVLLMLIYKYDEQRLYENFNKFCGI